MRRIEDFIAGFNRNRPCDFLSRHGRRRFREFAFSFRNDYLRWLAYGWLGLALGAVLSGITPVRAKAVESYINPEYIELAYKYGAEYEVSVNLIVTFIEIESSGQADAVSPNGQYIGLMQLNSETFSGDLMDPANNIEQGTAYLADLLENHTTPEAVSLYSGEGGRHGYYTEKVMYQFHKKNMKQAFQKELLQRNYKLEGRI